MGVIVTEQTTLQTGVVLDSYYASINTNQIRVEKIQTEEWGENAQIVARPIKYLVDAKFTKWISKEAKEAGSKDIGYVKITDIKDDPITNAYDVLYAKFKEMHPTAVDA